MDDVPSNVDGDISAVVVSDSLISVVESVGVAAVAMLEDVDR